MKCFPNVVSELPRLAYLNMKSNKLKELPENFTNIVKKHVKFKLEYNMLYKPPQVICNDGNAILNYFKSIAKFGEVHSKRLRLVVLGNTGAGKTSLVNGLLMGESRLTEQDERTEGIEIRKWYPDPANNELEIEIWDFGGHMEYQSVSHYFFEEHSLFLLVVDVSEYEKTDASYNEKAGKWIDELKSIVLRPVIMVAATKCDLVDGSIKDDRCGDLLKKIAKHEKLDAASIKSDLEQYVQKYCKTSRKEKLKLLTTVRPILPKSLFSTSSKQKQPTNEVTCIVGTSARVGRYQGDPVDLISLKQELIRTGSNTDLFPHLGATLPSLWKEIEESLPTLKEEMEKWVGPKYLTFKQLEKWLCEHIQTFNGAVDRNGTLDAVLSYLVKLGIVLRFKRVEQLQDYIFPDPQWLILLVKEVVHHDLQSHLQFKEDFTACDMDEIKFENEKRDLIVNGLLSESLLRCIWFEAVPKEADFEKLVPLLYHFDVGYKMTRTEATFANKDVKKNYILIPALMTSSPQGIDDASQTNDLEIAFQTKSVYRLHSAVPIGLFERQMVRCHHGSDYMRHWKDGFFGFTNYEEQEEVKFCVTKGNKRIEFTTSIKNSNQINCLWMVVLRLHQIFTNMVQELWPELRYRMYNKCPECKNCHHELDFDRLLEAPDCYSGTVLCEANNRGRPVRIKNKFVFPTSGNLFC